MATKLFRLVNDKKKSVNTNISGKQFRDIQSEEYIADLEAKLSDLDMINKRLKENVILFDYQISIYLFILKNLDLGQIEPL